MMSSCYMPMLEKLKKPSKNNQWVQKTEVTRIESKVGITRQLNNNYYQNTRPVRDSRGLTVAKGVGEFPNDVILSIRHEKPTLSFSDVRYQREHQNHTMTPEQYRGLQKQLNPQQSEDGQPRGVLTLGLPRMFTKNKKAGGTTTSYQDHHGGANYARRRRSSLPRKTKLPSSFHDLQRPPSAQSDFVVRDYQSSVCPPNKMHPFNLALREASSLSEIAGESKHRQMMDESCSNSSSTESDSIGGGGNNNNNNSNNNNRHQNNNNSKFNNHFKQQEAALRSSEKLGRLSPMVTSPYKQNNLFLKQQQQDLGYHTLSATPTTSPSSSGGARATPTSSLDSAASSDLCWDVRATKTPISDLHILTHNAKHAPVAKRTLPLLASKGVTATTGPNPFDFLTDQLILHILSFVPSSTDLVRCSRISRRFYFLAWEPVLWQQITLSSSNSDVTKLDTDLAIKTIFRLLSRNSREPRLGIRTIRLGGCVQLTDRGLAMIARRCPELRRLEIQHCCNITNGGLMDLMTKCQALDHLDVTGCPMISTIGVHQPSSGSSTTSSSNNNSNASTPIPPVYYNIMSKRQLNLQYLDLTDCQSIEDAGLKMIVELCPQLTYLFLRRCFNITDVGIKYVASYCLSLKEFSISDCVQVTDLGLFELAKLGPNLRYLSVAKCEQISDAGVKQIAKLCYKLRYLNVRGCEAVSDDAIETVARSCSRLRSLDIGKCDVTDVGLKMLSENCPNLKKLSVKSCEMVSDKGIQSVAYYCRGLQQLNIQDCPITVEGYRLVKKLCRKCIIEHTHPGFF